MLALSGEYRCGKSRAGMAPPPKITDGSGGAFIRDSRKPGRGCHTLTNGARKAVSGLKTARDGGAGAVSATVACAKHRVRVILRTAATADAGQRRRRHRTAAAVR